MVDMSFFAPFSSIFLSKILSMSGQASVFAAACAAGAAIGLIYDVFRLVRRIIPHSAAVIHIEDTVFWVSVSLLMFYVTLQTSYGKVRFFNILGAALGALLYFMTAGRLFAAASERIEGKIRSISLIIKKLLHKCRINVKFKKGKNMQRTEG